MRHFVLLALAVACVGGCKHAGKSVHASNAVGADACATATPAPMREAVATEERCPPGAPGSGEGPVCAGTVVGAPQVTCAPAEPGHPMLRKFLGGHKEKAPCAPQEIHVNVPAPKVIIRKEEKERAPRAAAAPRPGNEVMLVPTTVYVPYARMTPRGPASMVPLNMTPGEAPPQPVAAPPPCMPEPAKAPACAPAAPACAPGAPSCAPGASNCAPGTTGAAAPAASETQTIDALNRRCGALENKIDSLIDALKARHNR